MAKNNDLNVARKGKNDEFYTRLTDIEKEVCHYWPYFEGKKVLCNCNDALHTGFATYFALQFEHLKLKELICTTFAMNEGEHGVVYRYRGDKNGNNVPDIEEWEQTPMHGNGGFNTPEGLALIDEADIIVTNPPFSLFREFISIMTEHNKKFLIIGNTNAITYKEVFPLIKENKLWLGVSSFNTGMYFLVGDDFVYADSYKFDKEKDGEKVSRVASVCWYTNLDHKKRHEEMILYKKYNEEEFPQYDNYKAIEVSKTCDIPMDYEGVMGVPISFLDKFSPDQFEIIGITENADYLKPFYVEGCKTYHRGIINGQVKYARILIRFKK